MGELTFHKCMICNSLFYHGKKTVYCPKCIPSFTDKTPSEKLKDIYQALNDREVLEHKRALERERWKRRMQNPAFREKERIRSLAKRKADMKYRKEIKNGKTES